MIDRLYRRGRFLGLATTAAVLTACGGGGSADSVVVEPFYVAPTEEWKLVWADEFDGASVDSANWSFQEGDGTEYGVPGWGNNELQYYEADNASIADVDGDSSLVISAEADIVGGKAYTSSRMRSIDKFDFEYGRVEIRAKAAPGDGMWSAIWMMPTDSTYGTWAAGGEVDIMEVVNAGTENQGVFLAAHYGFEWPLNQIVTAPAEVDDASDWHTYALEWSGEYLRWYVDGVHLRTVENKSYYSYYWKNDNEGYAEATNPAAPFDQDFHLIVNLAVGGIGPGVELDPAAVPGEMAVDYIRVYECEAGGENGTGCNVNADRTLDTPDAVSPYVYSTPLYTDGGDSLSWIIAGSEITRDLSFGVGWAGPDEAMMVTEVAVEGRGNVIDISTTNSGNAVVFAADGESMDVYGHQGGGELKFDMYIDSSMTAPFSSIGIKMDSGWPALGGISLDVANLPKDEWFSYSVSINELMDNPGEMPLDLGAVMNAMVVEPSLNAHVMIDNVSFKCGTPGRDGCGVAAPVADTGGQEFSVFGSDGVVNTALFDKGDGATQGMCGSSGDTGWSDYCGDTGSAAGNLISWQLTDTGDADLGTGVNVTFGAGTDSGVFFFGSTAGVDLSDYRAEGFLRFSLRLPPETAATGMVWKLDCFFPCSTGDQVLDLTGYEPGTWQDFEFSVAEIAEMGDVDLTKINTGLVLFPTFGSQNNLSFEVANVRYEVDGEEPAEQYSFIAGTWQLAKVPNALVVGPTVDMSVWWASDAGTVDARACLFDDNFIFGPDGSYRMDLGSETWLEPWQGVDGEECGTPLAPHDGTSPGTYTLDEDAMQFTVNGQGNYVGLAKVYNGCEIGADGCVSDGTAAPESITYDYSLQDDGTMLVSVLVQGTNAYWSFVLEKVAGVPPVIGTWQLAPEPNALVVGPTVDMSVWWASDEGTPAARACLFDDEYVFNADGSFENKLGDETWLEPWQGAAGEECGAPVAPHDGSNPGTWAYDSVSGQVTLTGQGNFLGIAKVYNGCEIGADGCVADPTAAPESITYDTEILEDGKMKVDILVQGTNAYWTFLMEKKPEAPPAPVVGNWKLAPVANALVVGPTVDNSVWWASDEGTVTARACLFDDVYQINRNGTFQNVLGDQTWLEPWQGAAGEECGAPVAPHDGSNPGTWEYDEEMGQLTLNGQGNFLGIAKVYNGCEIGADDCVSDPSAAPESITYDVMFEDDGTMMLEVLVQGTNAYWNFLMAPAN